MTPAKVPAHIMEKRVALLAWEGACERLTNALQQKAGVPALTDEEFGETISRVRGLLETLERLHWLEPRAPGPERGAGAAAET